MQQGKKMKKGYCLSNFINDVAVKIHPIKPYKIGMLTPLLLSYLLNLIQELPCFIFIVFCLQFSACVLLAQALKNFC